MEKISLLNINEITLNPKLQPRTELSEDVLAEYQELWATASLPPFPPVAITSDGKKNWLTDGYHRVRAAARAGIVKIPALVTKGSFRDAQLRAVGANSKHGLRRTLADKEHVVRRMLGDKEWSTWSDSEIARRCAVTHPFVARVRQEKLSPQLITL